MHLNHPNSQPHVETEVFSDHDVQILQFSTVIKRSVNHPHSSVTTIVALERALESGENNAPSALAAPVLENVSHDQFQAFSYVPSDSFAFDSDSSFVITPPPILEGRDIVKCYGTKALVVPMHSGILQGDKSNSLLYNSVDNRKKICWNEDFHSKYNGCRWKGGRLRLEKAKEDCLVRLKREWEQGALDYATQKPPTAASEEEMPNTTQSSKSNTKHLNIFFPRLRKLVVHSSNKEGKDTESIIPLPWYPENLAWHSNFSRKQLRKNQTLGRTD
ncbi:hypothetical protein JHK87_049427 [Glycine soja]|nr:hypothetical protein JHK87_049427 [Glycine soja]